MKYLHYIVIAVVSVSVVVGLYFAGSPNRARQLRLDERRVNDLQTIQSQLLWHWQSKKSLPQTLSELSMSSTGYTASTDPETQVAYEYRTLGALQFELCATFSLPTEEQKSEYRGYYSSDPYFVGQMDWKHDAGRFCYIRTIDKDRYDQDQAAALKPVPVY